MKLRGHVGCVDDPRTNKEMFGTGQHNMLKSKRAEWSQSACASARGSTGPPELKDNQTGTWPQRHTVGAKK